MSIIGEIAAAIVNEMNDHSFSQPFQAELHFMPETELADLDVLHVTVAPSAMEFARASRSTVMTTYNIDIGVQQRIPKQDLDDQVDALLAFVSDELLAYLQSLAVSVSSGVPKLSSAGSIDPIYSPDHLRENNCFTSVIRLAYVMVS